MAPARSPIVNGWITASAVSGEEFQSIIELIDNEEVVVHVLERSGARFYCAIRFRSPKASTTHSSKSRNCRTPSLWQARQPVYRTSIARWRRYEAWLGEFGRLLLAAEREASASGTSARPRGRKATAQA